MNYRTQNVLAIVALAIVFLINSAMG